MTDGNVQAAVLTIIFITIFGAYSYGFMVHKTVTTLSDRFNAFQLAHQKDHNELTLTITPIQETFMMMRRVQESRLVETFLDGK